MGWFEHRHWWRLKLAPSVVINESKENIGAILLEDCRCGAVRTIEFRPGEDPIVRVVKPEA